jgi:hypothetical protein
MQREYSFISRIFNLKKEDLEAGKKRTTELSLEQEYMS